MHKIEEHTKIIQKNVGQDDLKSTLNGITSHHRIQASPGYHNAALFCLNRLADRQIPAEILTYPAEEGICFQNAPSFDFWECKDAWCRLDASGEILADFKSDPYSLIQRSSPWPYWDKPIEIIYLNKGTEESAYDSLDFNGKIVFVRSEYNTVRSWAVEKRGAIGYITDYVAPEPGCSSRLMQHDYRKYTSFWWRPGQKRTFGFVLTPDQGDRLAGFCEQMAKDHIPVTVHCMVDSHFQNGKLEVVTAAIEGTIREEILLAAHLCHPFGSANDNASGCAALIEGICTLNRLIENRTLTKPYRTIRILLVPEILGSYAYLNGLKKEERSRIKLALTMDMVGGSQDGRGPLTLFETPHCAPSIGNALGIAVLNSLQREVLSLNSRDYISMFHTAVNEYIDGSDHGLYNDPVLDISSPLLCQWPDKTYHTNHDTPDVIDYALLGFSCAFGATYGYCAATLDIEDLEMLCACNYARMCHVIADFTLQCHVSQSLRLRIIDDYIRYYSSNISAAKKLLPQEVSDGFEEICNKEKERIRTGASLAADIPVVLKKEQPVKSSDDDIDKTYNKIPCRRFFGRMDYGFGWISSGKDESSQYAAYLEKVGDCPSFDAESNIIYYIDGKRTIREIARLVIPEWRHDRPDIVAAYIHLLEQAGLITFKEEHHEI